MSTRRLHKGFSGVIFLFIAFFVFCLIGCPPLQAPGQIREATVTHVIDGDTIVVDDKEKVRYLGIDTPERDQPYFIEALKENKRLVYRKRVRLEFDVETKDKYGRTLAYVWVEGKMVNSELVRKGLARVYIIPPNVKYRDLLLEAEKEARENHRGLWKLSSMSELKLSSGYKFAFSNAF